MKFKKFIWCGIAAIVIGGFAMFNASLNSQNESGAIYKANIEAMTTSESGPASCFPQPTPCGGPDANGRCKASNCINCMDNHGCHN
jgi:hypothetical protein